MRDRAVEVEVGEAEVELASGLLWGAGVTAVAEEAAGPGRVRLRADLPPGGVRAAQRAVGGRWTVVEVEVDDGRDAWRAHARSARAGRSLVVRPPWVDLPADLPAAAVVIEVDPGAAFGHGSHPTTRLCLAALEELLAGTSTGSGTTVLDVGCGSGVLAVAAACLGAARVVAVDVDPVAVEVTRRNAERNGVDHLVEALAVPAAPEPGVAAGGDPLAVVPGRFDVVVANIGATALVALAPSLVARTEPGGTLVLSGLLEPPPPEVGDALSPLVVVARPTLDGWSALVAST